MTPESPTTSIKTERDIALCRSLLYEALSLGFLPPTSETCQRLGQGSSVLALAQAARHLDEQTGTRLEEKVLALGEARNGTNEASLREAYRELFGHTARGAVPPYETEYGEDEIFQKPQEMSDISGFLSAFGLRLGPSSRERVDHVACELEFLSFLARKAAHALEIGDAEMLEATRRATRLFLKDHLGRFGPAFVIRMRQEDSRGLHGALAGLLLALLQSDCGRYGAPLGPEVLRLRLPIEDGAPMACGSAAGCPASCGPSH